MKQSYAFALFAILLFGQTAQDFAYGAPVPVAQGKQKIIKYTRGMTINSLAGKADTEQMELPSGRRITVGDARRMQAAAQRMRAAKPGSRRPAALKLKPAAKGTPIKTKADLAAALKRPDSDTVQLPNGKLVTVGQLKFVQPLVEKRLGRKLDAALQQPAPPSGPVRKLVTKADLAAALKRPDNETVQLPSGNFATIGQIKAAQPEVEKRLGRKLGAVLAQPAALSGPAIKVSRNTSEAEWRGILQKPDKTVLESPNGKRITVGGMKKAFVASKAVKLGTASGKAAPVAAPRKIAPTAAPTNTKPAIAPKKR